ncbi:hypothetical protein AB0M46_23395 [Dactylosporangium sp. NPDC051485]|uniref:hypothetical protein n=1 Tax=Dactylosporangium sp. NPDC051485 TaxID=3154846 RepID=UPI0034485BF1
MTPPHTTTPARSAVGGPLWFDPAAVLTLSGTPPLVCQSAAEEFVGMDERSGLWLLTGDATVGQACHDPRTFAVVPVPVEPDPSVPARVAAAGRSAVRGPVVAMDARERAMLRMVWPATVGHADLVWGRRIRVHAEQAAAALASASSGVPGDVRAWPGGGGAPVDRLACAVIGSVFGICGGTIGEVRTLLERLAHRCAMVAESAALPLAVLREVVGRLVRERAAEPVDVLNPAQPDAVFDDVLVCRGFGADRLTLDGVTGLCTGLLAAAWDATAALLPRLVDTVRADPDPLVGLADPQRRADLTATVLPDLPPVSGWLTTTTQTVVLHGVRIPADAPCLLLLDPAGSGGSPRVAGLRWLLPANPAGAGMVLARLTADHLLAALARYHADPARAIAVSAVSAAGGRAELTAPPHG